jgi:hypothetical protein
METKRASGAIGISLSLAMAAGCGVQGLQSVTAPKVYVTGVPVVAVTGALAMWNDAVGIGLILTGDPRVSDITVTTVTDDCGAAPDGGKYLGYDDQGTTDAAICTSNFSGPGDPLLAVTIAHELGHVMGMHHLSGTALMNRGVGPNSVITDADIAQFRLRWGF